MANNGVALSITVTSFAAAPDVDLSDTFAPSWFEAYLTSASVVAFSFDGVNDHGRLDSANMKSVTRQTRAKKVWFRVVSGTNPATLFASHWS